MQKFRNMRQIAGSVILYNPDIDVVDNIESYIDYLDVLYIVDNGNGRRIIDIVLSRHLNVETIVFSENMGIAKPLNVILQKTKDKFRYLLTMDQDSKFTKGSMEQYISAIEDFDWSKTLALGPCLVIPNENHENGAVKWLKEIRLITSGNIIYISNAVKIGGFNEDLFIDEVDYEFCYRGLAQNLDCYKAESGIYLQHIVGNPIKYWRITKWSYTMNHGAIRKYYIFRNRLFVLFKYFNILSKKFLFKYYVIENIKMIVDIILGETDKIKKLSYCCKGIVDFCRGRMGKK